MRSRTDRGSLSDCTDAANIPSCSEIGSIGSLSLSAAAHARKRGGEGHLLVYHCNTSARHRHGSLGAGGLSTARARGRHMPFDGFHRGRQPLDFSRGARSPLAFLSQSRPAGRRTRPARDVRAMPTSRRFAGDWPSSYAALDERALRSRFAITRLGNAEHSACRGPDRSAQALLIARGHGGLGGLAQARSRRTSPHLACAPRHGLRQAEASALAPT